MHTVELLEQGLDLARRSGYAVRQEWLGGSGGGGCELRGRKFFFLDMSLGPADQLDQLVQTLRGDTRAASLPMPYQLRQLLELRRSA